MAHEIDCKVCNKQEIFCPKCKTKAIHNSVKALHGQTPSITKIEITQLNRDLPEAPKTGKFMEYHNFVCPQCFTFFAVNQDIDKNKVKIISKE